MNRPILVIRGGGIGDFILTLPAVALLREAFPGTQLEILGYRRVLGLVDGRYYADATRSIDYGPMAACFNPRATMAQDLAEYFLRFGQIISYVYDPDRLFESSLRNIGVKNMISALPRVGPGPHAARQLARPLECLALFLEDPCPRIHPSAADFAAASRLIPEVPWVGMHPGSGGQRKTWPIERWASLAGSRRDRGFEPVIFGGEADGERVAAMRRACGSVRVIENAPLEVVGACLAKARLFIGHDTGISHLAAAAGAPCLVLFGPTDPTVWAPPHPSARVLRALDGQMESLTTDEVVRAVLEML